MNHPSLDVFMCVHQRDVGYLLELSLRLYALNFRPAGRLVIVTNHPPSLRELLARLGMDRMAEVTADEEWLTRRELELSGWFRQQVIKLRAFAFCRGEHFCNLGADTLLLRPVEVADLLDGGFPVLYYRRHIPPTTHYGYEWLRLRHVARLLGVQPKRAARYVDFVSDLFCFNREVLLELDEHLRRRYGHEPYDAVLRAHDARGSRHTFGEWTLYSTFLLDYLGWPVTLRESSAGFLHQVHSRRGLRAFRFNTKVAHFVGKDFDTAYIRRRLVEFGLVGEEVEVRG